MSISIDSIRQKAARTAWRAVAHGDRLAQHINVYRVFSYELSRDNGDGAWLARRCETGNHFLGSFETHDQDRDRTPLARKLQLSEACPILFRELLLLIERAQKRPIHNLALLHQLSQTRLKIFGDKNVSESLSYARRAALKLHPDKAKDLEGWEYPGTVYGKHSPPGYKYEHAKHGAAALFALHCGMKSLLENDHYRVRLYSSRVLRGGQLTLAQIASDITVAAVVGALFVCLKGKPLAPLMGCCAAAYALVLAAMVAQATARHIAKSKEVKCRDVVPYRARCRFPGEVK